MTTIISLRFRTASEKREKERGEREKREGERERVMKSFEPSSSRPGLRNVGSSSEPGGSRRLGSEARGGSEAWGLVQLISSGL